MKYLLIVFLLMTTQAEAARIKLQKDSPSGVVLTLRGVIEEGDTQLDPS